MMASVWLLGVETLCFMFHAVAASSQMLNYEGTSEGLEVNTGPSCTDLLADAFGNSFTKPGVRVCFLLNLLQTGVYLDARAYCQGLNATLQWDVADIADEEELQIIANVLMQRSMEESVVWIGQNDMETEGVWKYVNTTMNQCHEQVYLKWRDSEPNGGRRENCIIYSNKGEFVDYPCDLTASFLCKVTLAGGTSCPSSKDDLKKTPNECVNISPNAFSKPSVPGVCYVANSTEQRTFREAQEFCRSLPGGAWSVADIMDAAENLFLEVWIRDHLPKTDTYWIGLNDREKEGVFRYTSSRRTPVYLNNAEGEPNGGTSENCTIISKKTNGKFYDVNCDWQANTLCKTAFPTVTRAIQFEFVSSDATCSRDDVLLPTHRVKSMSRCAEKCLRRADCMAFGFAHGGAEDACMLCGGVHEDLQPKAGSRYYEWTM